MAFIVGNQQQLNSYRSPWYTASLPSIGICLGLIGAGLVASVIVLSLIPVYLPRRDVNVKYDLTKPFDVTYRSDLINGSALTIADTMALSASLENALHLNGIVNLGGRFIPLGTSAARRKKRADVRLARTRRSTDGDLLNVQFSLRLPLACRSRNCRTRATNNAYFHISTLYTTFSLSTTFSDGRTLLVNLSFCSFDGSGVCQVSNSVCANEEVEDVCAGYDAVCQTGTGLCQGDCSDVIDVCQDSN